MTNPRKVADKEQYQKYQKYDKRRLDCGLSDTITMIKANRVFKSLELSRILMILL